MASKSQELRKERTSMDKSFDVNFRGLGFTVKLLDPIPKEIEIHEPVSGRVLSAFNLGDKVRFRHPQSQYHLGSLGTVIDYQGRPAVLFANNKAESNSFHEPYWYLDSDIVNDWPRVNTRLKPNPDRDSRIVADDSLKKGDLFKWGNGLWHVKIERSTGKRLYTSLSNEYNEDALPLATNRSFMVELVGHIEFNND